MVALGTFHHTTLDWDNWAPASLVVLYVGCSWGYKEPGKAMKTLAVDVLGKY